MKNGASTEPLAGEIEDRERTEFCLRAAGQGAAAGYRDRCDEVLCLDIKLHVAEVCADIWHRTQCAARVPGQHAMDFSEPSTARATRMT